MTVTPPRRIRSIRISTGLVATGLLALAANPVGAEEAGQRHAAWQGCLDRNFRVHVRLTGRTLAADAALAACRPSEDAYLAALARSPLLDGAEIDGARLALVGRARGRLLDRRAVL